MYMYVHTYIICVCFLMYSFTLTFLSYTHTRHTSHTHTHTPHTHTHPPVYALEVQGSTSLGFAGRTMLGRKSVKSLKTRSHWARVLLQVTEAS